MKKVMWRTWVIAIKIPEKRKDRGVKNIIKKEKLQRMQKISDVKLDERLNWSKNVIKKVAAFSKYTRTNHLFVGERHQVLGDQLGTCGFQWMKMHN